jgi:hypothetical protein
MEPLLLSLSGMCPGIITGHREGRWLVKISELKTILPLPDVGIDGLGIGTYVQVIFENGDIKHVIVCPAQNIDHVEPVAGVLQVLQEPGEPSPRKSGWFSRIYRAIVGKKGV